MHKTIGIVLGTLILHGWAQVGLTADQMPQSNSPEYVEVPVVIVQLCLPNKTVAFEDVEIDLVGTPKARTLVEVREANGIRGHRKEQGATTATEDARNTDVVRRWVTGTQPAEVPRYFLAFGEVLNRDGIMSAGGGHISLMGSTDRNQPVFEKQGHRPQDYIALETSVEVSENGQRESVKYWFKLPQDVPQAQFTKWQEPMSQEDKTTQEKQKNPTFWNLTHGRSMDVYEVRKDAPKIRFKVMRIRDYYDENRFWYRSQKAVAEKYYRGVTREARDKVHFVPRNATTIPAC